LVQQYQVVTITLKKGQEQRLAVYAHHNNMNALSPFHATFTCVVTFTRFDLAFFEVAVPVGFGMGEWGMFMKYHKLSMLWRTISCLGCATIPLFPSL
jgi:hypothetical protein